MANYFGIVRFYSKNTIEEEINFFRLFGIFPILIGSTQQLPYAQWKKNEKTNYILRQQTYCEVWRQKS